MKFMIARSKKKVNNPKKDTTFKFFSYDNVYKKLIWESF